MRQLSLKTIVIAILLAIGFGSCTTTTQVDLVVYNANVYIVNDKFQKQEALAIKDGKILETGTSNIIRKKYTSSNTIDASGKFIYPGFIDAHSHFIGYGQSLFNVDLFGSASWNEVITRLKTFVQQNPNEKWIVGRGWDQNKWLGKSFPVNDSLNILFPGKYVLLERIDGHASIASDNILKLAGIHKNSNIKGGEVVMQNDKPTGVLVDNAVNLINKVLQPATANDYKKWLTAAEQNCFKKGLTTVSDCGINNRDVEILDSLQKNKILNIRIYGMLSDLPENFTKWLSVKPYKTDKLFINGFKFYADGALGSRGACLLQPYNDRPNWFGFMLKNRNYYDSMARLIAKTPYQMCTHAIGDSANREILNIYNKVLSGKNDKRWRIEHAQVVDPHDIDHFGDASIIPSVQPTHATSDMYWAEDRLGKERIASAYAYQALLKQNGWLPLGTDFPVEDIDPLKTFYAAVYRKDNKGFPAEGFQTENALSREEALKGMTIWAARASFLENEIGSLEKGKLADFIILDQDLMTADSESILNIKVLQTVIGGKTVFKRPLISPEGKAKIMD